MNNQRHRHKNANVFKVISTVLLIGIYFNLKHYQQFKSFNDIVASINIRQNALYRVRDPNLEHEENETSFRESYLKWTVDNLSEEFKNFQKKISSLVTLEQLLNAKDFVVELLLDSLKKATTLSLQSLLE